MDINIHVGMLSWIACDTLLIFSLAGPMWHYWLLLLSHTSSCRPCLKDLFGECGGIFLLSVYILLLLVVWLYKVYWLHRNRLCLSMVNRQLKKNKIKSFCKEFLSDKIIIFFCYVDRFFLPVSMVICNDIFAYIFGNVHFLF